MELYISGTGQRIRVHTKDVCQGPNCVIHNPSGHHMRGWQTNWRSDRNQMERICSHGVGHPDPDCRGPNKIHGCDGCCTPPKDTVRVGDLINGKGMLEILTGKVVIEIDTN